MAITKRFVSKVGLDGGNTSITNIGTAGSSLSLTNANAITLTTSGVTTLTLPTSGTLLTTSGGTMAGNLTVPTGYLISVADQPSVGTSVANKNYVDAVAAGLTWKNATVAATTANITLSAPQTIDGVAVIAGDRVLVKNQTTTATNGIYIVAAGAWTRAPDMDASTPLNEFNGAGVLVTGGATQVNTAWTITSKVTTVGTDAVTWAQFNGASGITNGVGLDLVGNTLSVDQTLSLTSLTATAAVTGATLVSNVATGTAPLTVTSTTNVANLNADLLDGYHASTTAVAGTIPVYNGSAQLVGSITGSAGSLSSTLAVASGGTGATTASAALTNLGASPVAGSSSLVTVGTITAGTWTGTDVALDAGGTNASLTAVAGGVVYSTASAMAITPAGLTGQVLVSAAAGAPVWTNASSIAAGSSTSVTMTDGTVNSTSLTTSTTTANQVVDSIPSTTYRTVKYLIQVTSGAAYQSTELLVVHDGTTVSMVEYGTIATGATLASFDSTILTGALRLLVTPVNAVTVIKVIRTAINV